MASATFDVYPAIDLRDGRCVRLYQGDFARETVYDADPVAVARRYMLAGARWIHVVDLDAARTGVPANRETLRAIVEEVHPSVSIQAGGGVRDRVAAAALEEAAVDRIVVGTAAIEDPELLRELGARGEIAAGLDVRDDEVAVRGWTEGSGRKVLDVLAGFEDVRLAAVIVTDIGRDGALVGPDLGGLATILAATDLPVIASGGVRDLDDLRALASLETGGRQLAGVIVGRALYEGRFTLEEAIAACALSG